MTTRDELPTLPDGVPAPKPDPREDLETADTEPAPPPESERDGR